MDPPPARSNGIVMTHRSRLARVGFFLISLMLFSACQQRPALSADIPTTTLHIIPAQTDTPDPSPTLTPTEPLPSQTPVASKTAVIPTGTAIHTAEPYPPAGYLIPDSEVVFSASAVDFDVQGYLDSAGGFLAGYRQYLMVSDWTSGADIVSMIAIENSISPRLLLALLEYQSGCIFDPLTPDDPLQTAIGAPQAWRQDLYGQLIWATRELWKGYYGHLDGTLTEFSSTDGKIFASDPDLNPGTVALQYFFSRLYPSDELEIILDPETGFPAFYRQMFGDPWVRALQVEPLLPENLTQPELRLPFPDGRLWAYTGGPHPVFEKTGPWGAIDFAPAASLSGCVVSNDWALAMADGPVVRSSGGVVIQDLDGDGLEQTGWVLMYLHIDEPGRVMEGTFLKAGDPVGHPSCLGGTSTGTHVHIARKYNGVWITADGSIPFVLDGWQVHQGEEAYQGTLTKDDQTIIAHQYGSLVSHIYREADEK